MAAPSLKTNDREVELIQRVCRGEHEAFYELVRPYERAIYFAARGYLAILPPPKRSRRKRS